MRLEELLREVAAGTMDPKAAAKYLESYGFIELGYQKIDLHRGRRTSIPEVIFGLSKSIDQLREVVSYFAEAGHPLLVTKLDATKGVVLADEFSQLRFDPVSGLARIGASTHGAAGRVAVISAGSSDLPVAEEAAGTLDFFGVHAIRAYDCGVAGLHRLFGSAEKIAAADVLIVVAGMEGALASVVAGMFPQPAIAVPTSVGYGASFQGLAALLAMLNSCAPGVTVVNIDNGFGAAVAARGMLALRRRLEATGDVPGAEDSAGREP